MSLACSVTAERAGYRVDVDFASDGRIVGIEGPSGAGKTTLLHALAGLIPVERAHLRVDGVVLVDTADRLEPPAHARRIGYVFQDVRLFPHLTVAGNIAYGHRIADAGADVRPLLALLGIEPLMTRWVRNLSGGEARRVAIARALATRPRLLLLDEPFAGLEQDRRAELIPYLVALTREIEVSILVVSHEAADLEALGADRVTMRAGRISPDRRR
jgi:molybdate transport system ATP-binding protein